MRNKFEHNAQVEVIQFCDKYSIPIFAIPNGGVRGGTKIQRIINGKNLKLEGVRPGIPDLFIPRPINGSHGLFIEMKYGKNKTSPEQREWITLLQSSGYQVWVCYSSEDAIEKICKYLRITGKIA